MKLGKDRYNLFFEGLPRFQKNYKVKTSKIIYILNKYSISLYFLVTNETTGKQSTCILEIQYQNENYELDPNSYHSSLLSWFLESNLIPSLESKARIKSLYKKVMRENVDYCINNETCVYNSIDIINRIAKHDGIPEPKIIRLFCPIILPSCLKHRNGFIRWSLHQALIYRAIDDNKVYVLDPSFSKSNVYEFNLWFKTLDKEKVSNFQIYDKLY